MKLERVQYLFSAFAFLEANKVAMDIGEDFWIDVVTGVVNHRVSQDELVEIFTAQMGGDAGDLDW